ncbi:hypothetical protein T8A63_07415 [Sulfitobacter sp. OXR-159]|uniref:hypothetical protein n=1 Tax=Sulfitobacter sp. OXR-159 TaxID=3100174 RepID=UPI002AC92C8C|nr:hypothetical protein [Sulfitobacter sp. OXR-159]WPZ30784.1 hypothetical protein T8A63_06905 [Sulfitobacter sp. OXR-159]WPZ30885.1 hypothetical protein T8A63_07415 [Sulfitobacter sp. OXR-159]
MSNTPKRTVQMSQNDYVLFGLISEILNDDERTELIEMLTDYQNAEIEMKDVFRKVMLNHEARWEAFHKVKSASKSGGVS